MGSAIAASLAKGNYRLLLKGTRPEELAALVTDISKRYAGADVEAAVCPTDASWEADIIILAVPFAAEKEIAEKIKEVANQKIVVSIANPLNETYTGLVTTPDTSAAEELQKLLPNSKVVKAFNTTFAANFLTPVIAGTQADAFIASNNEEAMQTVAELVTIAGFNPVIAGDLSISRTLERMQLLMIQLSSKYNYNWPAGWKILHN